MVSRASLKSDLRQRMRQRRRELTPEQQALAASALVEQCSQLPAWPGAQRIGLYQAVDGEIGTAALAQAITNDAKTPYLPVVEDKLLRFAEWRGDEELASNRYGIGEPRTGLERCAADALDILCLPLVAWDRSGRRLGMGGGYYDRTLAQTPRPLLVGLAHSCQEHEALPRDEWDITLDWVVTELECLRCAQER